MDRPALVVTREGAVTRLEINRPEAANALTEALHWDLHRALDAFAGDDTQRACIIGAAGDRAFCSGSDLKEHVARGGQGHPYPPTGYAGITERFDLTKPVIAEVNGAAVGGGLELMLACDIVIASDTSRFGLPEPLVGGVAMGLGIERLNQHLGPKKAAELVLTGTLIDALEALRLGLVNAVVPRDRLKATTQNFVDRLLAAAPHAQRASKALLGVSQEDHDLRSARERALRHPAVRTWLASSDAAEGSRAFVERRPPSWASSGEGIDTSKSD